jgi:hypothetical protein
MPLFSPNGGVDETEPTLIADNALQDCDGAEYRVGEPGIFVARGRDQYGQVVGDQGRGIYEAGFDTGGYLLAHTGNSLSAAVAGSTTLTFALIDNLPTGSTAIVGSHYANRHYLATCVGNRRIELGASGVTAFLMGMSRSTFTIGTSVTQGVSNMTVITGLVYWATEYDSIRGIESMTGSSANTGAFASKDGVVLVVTGVSANPRNDQLRWYRSVDGGQFPDGGLIATTPIGTTTYTDTQISVDSLTVPGYGIVSIGGLDTERDAPPPTMSTIFGPFQDSLLGVDVADQRTLLFTPAGYPDSWPAGYGIPLETKRRDEIVTGVVLPGRIGVFCKDSVHVIYRLPRDSDSIFAAGEMQEIITDERGCVSRRGACAFTPIGGFPMAMWVARDGIWVSTLTGGQSPQPVTDLTDWDGRVDIANLHSCRLVDDPINRRIVFIYRRVTDSGFNTGIWYLDYQGVDGMSIRITFADHGPLADAQTYEAPNGKRQLASIDSRTDNGKVYIEATQDVDDSLLLDSAGSVRFRFRTKEFMPSGIRGTASLGKATYMHDAAPERVTHRFYFNRRDSNPEVKMMPDTTTRCASDVVLGKNVNSMSVELESASTTSYGVHWIDIEGMDPAPLAGREGA